MQGCFFTEICKRSIAFFTKFWYNKKIMDRLKSKVTGRGKSMLAEQNIIIRPLEERDLPILTRWQSSEFRGAFQECQMESEIERKNQLMENGFCTPQFQMLMIEQDEVASGLIYLNFVREGLVRLGLVLDPKARGNHLGSRALMLCRDYLLDNFPVVRLEADTDIDNIAAQKVLERCGFCAEGVLRKYRFHHGSYHDSYLYSYIRESY